MYWQGLTDEELLRYAGDSQEAQLEIARRVLAGSWDDGKDELTERIAELERTNEGLRSENTVFEAETRELTHRVEDLEAELGAARGALS